MTDDEVVVGVSMWDGESHGTHNDPVSVTFLIAELNGHEDLPVVVEANSGKVPVKKIQQDLKIVDFLALFKRLEISLSPVGVLNDHEYFLI